MLEFYTYKKHRGYTPMVHIAETDQVVAVEFREGNESPNKEINPLGIAGGCSAGLSTKNDGVFSL